MMQGPTRERLGRAVRAGSRRAGLREAAEIGQGNQSSPGREGAKAGEMAEVTGGDCELNGCSVCYKKTASQPPLRSGSRPN